MKTIFNMLARKTKGYIWLLSFLSLSILFSIEYLLRSYIDLMPLYIIVVLLASWYGSSKTGISLSIIISAFLLISSSGDELSYFYNNSRIAVIFVVNLLVAILVTNFRNVYGFEAEAADTDTLTGVHSLRSFYAEIANEILRSRRYEHRFSLAYIDVDDLKKINDTLGHHEGDRLLIELANCLTTSLRATDTVARIGGDEFVCLMPETEETQAKSAILNVESSLKKRMSKKNWNVSFSIGLVTFDTLPEDVHEALKVADELMYSVKKSKKNAIAYKVWKITTK
jgi:diguanylate cyclase (GGDEF)-like protein